MKKKKGKKEREGERGRGREGGWKEERRRKYLDVVGGELATRAAGELSLPPVVILLAEHCHNFYLMSLISKGGREEERRGRERGEKWERGEERRGVIEDKR